MSAKVLSPADELDQETVNLLKQLWSTYLDRDSDGVCNKDELTELLSQLFIPDEDNEEEPRSKASLESNFEVRLERMDTLFESVGESTRSHARSQPPILGQVPSAFEIDKGNLSVFRFEDFTTLVSSRLERNSVGTFRLCLVNYIIPLLYSAGTRLPFVFLPLEILKRSGSFVKVGMIMGLYQLARALANAMVVQVSRGNAGSSHNQLYFSLQVISLASWIFSYINRDEGVNYLFALSVTGLSEVVVLLQQQLVVETQADSFFGKESANLMAYRMRAQYCFVALGSGIALFTGGTLYATTAFEGVCIFAIMIYVAHMLAMAVYVALFSKYEEIHEIRASRKDFYKVIYQMGAANQLRLSASGKGFSHKDTAHVIDAAYEHLPLKREIESLFRHMAKGRDSIGPREIAQLFDRKMPNKKDVEGLSLNALRMMNTNFNGTIDEDEFVSFVLPRTYLSFRPWEKIGGMVEPYYMKYILVTQAIMALCIGTFLSTSVITYSVKYGVSPIVSGSVLAAGEVGGVCTLLVTNNVSLDDVFPPGSVKYLRILTKQPVCVPVVLCLVASVTILFNIPFLGTAIVFQLLMGCVNDLSVSLLNELTVTCTPTEKFQVKQATGQLMRRLGNVLTGVTGPILFSIHPALPFAMYGSILLLWTVPVFYFLYNQARIIGPKDVYGEQLTGMLDAFTFILERPWSLQERDYTMANVSATVAGRGMQVLDQLQCIRLKIGEMDIRERSYRSSRSNSRAVYTGEYATADDTIALLNNESRVQFMLGDVDEAQP